VVDAGVRNGEGCTGYADCRAGKGFLHRSPGEKTAFGGLIVGECRAREGYLDAWEGE
jgi:hypothetical protein